MDIQQIGYEAISQQMWASVGQAPPSDPTFSQTLRQSIQRVDQAQRQADKAVVDLVTGRQQNLHQTMIAMEQADLAFQTMMQIRNKLVVAYEEIFRMQL